MLDGMIVDAPTLQRPADVDGFLSCASRTALVSRVSAQIRKLGIERIYFQLVSLTGRVMGKSVPARYWEEYAEKGVQLWYGAVADVLVDRRGDYLGYGAEASELLALPDPDTFVQLPWDPSVARVFCTLFRNREDPQGPGTFLSSDCRGNLRRFHEAFKHKTGLELRVGCEPEMMWLKRGADGDLTSGTTRPLAYHIAQFETLSPIISRVNDYGRRMGLDMIQGDHEDAPGQLELNIRYSDVLGNADRLTTYRQICAQVAREFNFTATFMAKPFAGMSGNGCHHNVSLWRGGESSVRLMDLDALPGEDGVFTYREGGENAFLADTGDWMPTETGQNCIAGILTHLPALTAIAASTVNSYRRLSDTGFWAPVFADWGLQNRTTSVRVSAPGRVEFRTVDSLVNPYLMGAALLKAFEHGLDAKLSPGAPEHRNIYDAMERGKSVVRLPTTLERALDALESDPIIMDALPGDMGRCFLHAKRDEWERFIATVTDWDIERYLTTLP